MNIIIRVVSTWKHIVIISMILHLLRGCLFPNMHIYSGQFVFLNTHSANQWNYAGRTYITTLGPRRDWFSELSFYIGRQPQARETSPPVCYLTHNLGR